MDERDDVEKLVEEMYMYQLVEEDLERKRRLAAFTMGHRNQSTSTEKASTGQVSLSVIVKELWGAVASLFRAY